MFTVTLFTLTLCSLTLCDNFEKPPSLENILAQEKPFRMQKLNLIWEKALKKLSPEKIKLLYTDLKFQDKDEIDLKKLKADGLDKNGIKESLVRSNLNVILDKYDLIYEFRTVEDSMVSRQKEFGINDSQYKIVFRDKKLNKLWLNAEQQGFSEEELKTLREEFQHHQDKIDQYYQIMDKANKDPWFKDDPSNDLQQILEAEEISKVWKGSNPHQMLKEKHTELKVGYEYLTQQVIPSIRSMEFEEPQVNSLWELAKNASFSDSELESLRRELHHFEHRIKKLKNLAELEASENNSVDSETLKHRKKIKEYNYKVDKIYKELSNRIIEKHTEL